MAGALVALCHAGDWSYGAIWRSDPRDPRLLTIGECHCEDAATKIVEWMVNQVNVVGEGVIGRALISGECQWISDDTHFSLSPTSDVDNLDLFEGYTWWQHQRRCGIKTIAVVPIPALGVAQFGSMQKVPESLEFLYQVNGALSPTESISWRPSTKDIQKNVFQYNPQFGPHSPGTTECPAHITAEQGNARLLEDTITIDSLRNFASTSSKHSLSPSNGLTSYETYNGLHPHIVAMAVNSKPINADKVFHTVGNLQNNNTPASTLLIKSSKQPGSSLASAMTTYSMFNNLPRIDHGFSCVPNKLQGRLPTEESSAFRGSCSSFFSTDGEPKPSLFDNVSSLVQSAIIQEVGTTVYTPPPCELQELPNEIWGGTHAPEVKPDREESNGNNDLLGGTIFDPAIHDWWDDNALLGRNISRCGATATIFATEQAGSDLLSVDERGLFPETTFEELLEYVGNIGTDMTSNDPLAASVTDRQLPGYNLQDPFPMCKAQVPPLAAPSSSCTSGNIQTGTKTIPVSLRNLSIDDRRSLNIANSHIRQVKKTKGVNIIKKNSRLGESRRPKPRDRQLIQERVKELREVVPNTAKCSIDTLLERTIKHMLFLRSVTKYAEKIKQSDGSKVIDKDTGAGLDDSFSSVVLKDYPSAGSNGGATWAYGVAGQTMMWPIIDEDLAPPGPMLVEMTCAECGFLLEIADTIRGFGLTILKGLMEIRDGKLIARFIVEANKKLTRTDIFLSLVLLLQQKSLKRSSDQLTKVISNGAPSVAEHQQSPISIPVGSARSWR